MNKLTDVDYLKVRMISIEELSIDGTILLSASNIKPTAAEQKNENDNDEESSC